MRGFLLLAKSKKSMTGIMNFFVSNQFSVKVRTLEDFIKLVNWCLKELNEMKAWRFMAILITIIVCVYIWKM